MPGSVAVDLGFEAGALDMELTLGGLAPELLKLWGTPTADGVQFRFAGSYQAEDPGRHWSCPWSISPRCQAHWLSGDSLRQALQSCWTRPPTNPGIWADARCSRGW